MRLADALVTALRDWELRYVFGVSGANVEHVHDAIHRLGDGRLSSVLARREDGAAYMADGRARVHRTLGVCCSTSGAAMMNLAVGLAESYADSAPVLAIVGEPPTTLHGRGAFQDSSGVGRSVDAQAMLTAVTKRTLAIRDPHGFWDELRFLAQTALTGRPGPTAMLIPRDLYDADVGARPRGWPADLTELAVPAVADRAQVDALFAAVRQARRPVLLLGPGVRRSGAQDTLADFARRTGIPVATTLSARAEFPNHDPLYLGAVGAAGHPSAHAALLSSDLVVAVGTGLNMMTRAALGDLDHRRVAVVNIDPADVHLVGPPRLTVAADARRVAEALCTRLDFAPFRAPDRANRPRLRYTPRLAAAVAEGTQQHPAGLRQSTALTLLEKYFPAGGHIVLDAGNCAAAAIHLTDVPPGASSTIALGAGGMGYSVPAAIGAQLGAPPGTRTVAICGDGAFLMNGLEVHTAVDLGLPILYVIVNNGMHGMCVARQQLFFDARIECAQYSTVDFAALGRALAPPERLWTGTARTPDQLAACLADYQSSSRNRPGVLDLCIQPEEAPPFTVLLPDDEPTTAVAGTPAAPRPTEVSDALYR